MLGELVSWRMPRGQDISSVCWGRFWVGRSLTCDSIQNEVAQVTLASRGNWSSCSATGGVWTLLTVINWEGVKQVAAGTAWSGVCCTP